MGQSYADIGAAMGYFHVMNVFFLSFSASTPRLSVLIRLFYFELYHKEATLCPTSTPLTPTRLFPSGVSLLLCVLLLLFYCYRIAHLVV